MPRSRAWSVPCGSSASRTRSFTTSASTSGLSSPRGSGIRTPKGTSKPPEPHRASLGRGGDELTSSGGAQLRGEDLELLRFERRWRWATAGERNEAIRQTFDMSLTRYYQRLNAIIDLPGA